MNEEAFMKRNVKAVSLALSAVTAVQSMQFVHAVINAAESDHAAALIERRCRRRRFLGCCASGQGNCRC